jgi:hypothetical protein
MGTRIAPKTSKKIANAAQDQRSTLPPAVAGLLSKRQVCEALGRVSIRTLSEMISRGVFPNADVKTFGPKLPRWSVEVVNRWVREEAERTGEG